MEPWQWALLIFGSALMIVFAIDRQTKKAAEQTERLMYRLAEIRDRLSRYEP